MINFISPVARFVSAGASGLVFALSVDGQSCATSLISTSSSGTPSNSYSYSPLISGNSRFIIYYSDASNLVAGDNNGKRDVFLRDRANSVTELISVTPAGAPGNNDSYDLAISPSGRYVVFASDATNLVPLDTNARRDIFLRDRTLGTTELVSVSSSGAQQDNLVYDADLSADGRFVFFGTGAANLDSTDLNGGADLYVRDRMLGTTTLITRGNTGLAAAGESWGVHCSPDGHYVSFLSTALDLVTPSLSPYAHGQVYVYDSLSGLITLETTDTQGGPGNDESIDAALSANGQIVTFTSRSTDLIPGNLVSTNNVFVRNRLTSTTSLASVSIDGLPISGSCTGTSISDDGRYIAFDSRANNLIIGDTNGADDIFVRDLTTATTSLASVSFSCGPGTGESRSPSISADGRIVVFQSGAAQLTSNDINGYIDIFVNDRQPQANFYCTGKINSLGCLPTMSLVGWPSASAGPGFSVNASQFRNQKVGLFFYSTGGAFALPLWGGVMCVGLPRIRTLPQNSGGSPLPANDCTGTYQFNVTAWLAAGSDPGLAAGQQIWGQYWARDPGYAPPYNVSLTNGTTFVIEP